MSLVRWQQAFATALTDRQPATSGYAAQPGFAIYRNGLRQACIEAIEANHPAVLALVGREWLRAAAAVFIEQTLPGDVALIHYGAGFADFLRDFAPARELPWLAPVAALDRAWLETFCAGDTPCADATTLAALAPAAWRTLVLRPHAAARWLRCADHPAASLWRINRDLDPMPAEGLAGLAWHGEALLLTRPGASVQSRPIDPRICRLLDDCAAGLTIATALERLLADAPDLDAARCFADLLDAGAFAHPYAINPDEE